MQIKRVILDRGHGLHNSASGEFDPGAVSGIASEALVAAFVAGGVHQGLALAAIPVLVAPELSRSSLVKWVNELVKRGDLLISLHMNSTDSLTASGVETVYGSKAPLVRRFQALAFGQEFANGTGLKFRRVMKDIETPAGFKNGGLAIVRDTKCPSILLEMGFIGNGKDVKLVETYGATAVINAINRLKAESPDE